MTRCAELEPNEPRHKQQLERFRKAKEGGGRKAAVPTKL
jgi:hypothetical protein